MQTLMRKRIINIAVVGFCLFFSSKSFSQLQQTLDQVGYLLDDALFFSDKYITPATDAAVYQSSSNWMTTPKKKKLWDVTLGVHGNVFFVPNRDRSFDVSNSDFKFFHIESGASSTTLPSALGGVSTDYFVGDIGGSPVRVAAPNGINQERVFYPYLQGGIGLWKGTELLVKYSTKVKLKKGNYQVYGVGVKHNLSQYLKSLEKHHIHLAALMAYSKEDISFDFLDVQTPLGNLGLNQITGLVDTYQFQVSASKEWKRFELMGSVITNESYFRYQMTGPKGQIEDYLAFQDLVNDKLHTIYKHKINSMGELSGRYQFSKIYVQGTLAFGKFVNSNLSVQFEF